MKRNVQHLLTEESFYVSCIKGETYEQYRERVITEEEDRELDESFDEEYYGDRL